MHLHYYYFYIPIKYTGSIISPNFPLYNHFILYSLIYTFWTSPSKEVKAPPHVANRAFEFKVSKGSSNQVYITVACKRKGLQWEQ